MALARAEVRERHPMATANASVHVLNLAREPVWRKPFGHGVGIEECPVDALGRRAKHAVEANRIGEVGHGRNLLGKRLRLPRRDSVARKAPGRCCRVEPRVDDSGIIVDSNRGATAVMAH
jgi:hypothetical protein